MYSSTCGGSGEEEESLFCHLCKGAFKMICAPILLPIVVCGQCYEVSKQKQVARRYSHLPDPIKKRKRRLSSPIENPSLIINPKTMSAVKQATINQTDSMFCSKLPFEVREMVYRYLFADRDIKVILWPGQKGQRLTHTSVDDYNCPHCKVHVRVMCTCPFSRHWLLPLLKTCRFL